MNNRDEINQLVENVNESTKNDEGFLQSNDEPIVFVPAENIFAIEKVIYNWEVVKQQWEKMIPTTTVK